MRRSAIAVLVASLVGCQLSRTNVRVPTVRIAIHRDPVAFLPLRVAHTLGYYQQEGVAVELSEVAGGTKAIEALFGGSVDVAAGSLSDAIALAAEGRPVRGFLVLYTRPITALAVAPALATTIRSVRDLKGRTVGVSAPGSASHQILNSLLISNGLSPADVSTVSVGMSSSSVAALEYGKVDAAILLASAIAAFEQRQPGTRFLADTRTASGAEQLFGSEMFPSLSLLASDDWLRQNADTVQRLVRAVRRGVRWVHDQPPEDVREMIPEGARMPAADTDLRAIRDMQRVLSLDGTIPAGSAELVEKFVAAFDTKVRAAHPDLSRTYTNEFASLK